MCHYSSCQYQTGGCLHIWRLYCYQEQQSYLFISLYSYNYIISLPLKIIEVNFELNLCLVNLIMLYFRSFIFFSQLIHKCRYLEKIQIDIHLLSMTLLMIFHRKIKQIQPLKHLKYYYKFMKINLAHTIHKLLMN